MKQWIVISLVSLSLLACEENIQQSKTEQKTQQIKPIEKSVSGGDTTTRMAEPIGKKMNEVTTEAVNQMANQANVLIDSTTESVNQALQQTQLDQTLNDISQKLTQIGNDLGNDLELKEDDINDLAEKLGQLARKAGKSAKTLEKTTQTIGEAIQKGFAEGYNKESSE